MRSVSVGYAGAIRAGTYMTTRAQPRDLVHILVPTRPMGRWTVPLRFSGRDRELEEFRSLPDQARAGYGTALHVQGELGITDHSPFPALAAAARLISATSSRFVREAVNTHLYV